MSRMLVSRLYAMSGGWLKIAANSARDCKRLQLDWMILRTRLMDRWYNKLMIGLFWVAVLSLGCRVCCRGMALTFWRVVLTMSSGKCLWMKNSTISYAFSSKSVSSEHGRRSLSSWWRHAIFRARIVKRTVVQVRVRIGCFVMNGCCWFSLFQGNVQKCNRLFSVNDRRDNESHLIDKLGCRQPNGMNERQ